MKLTQLERANKVLGEIKELDEQIIKIEKMALEMASDEQRDVSITMSFDKPKEEKAEIDRDGYEMPMGILGHISLDWGASALRNRYCINPVQKESLFTQFGNNECLQILGMMLLCKQQKRQHLLNKLQKMGFQVQ